jgi:hypothetical protein
MTPAMQNQTALHVNALPNLTTPSPDPRVGYAAASAARAEAARAEAALPKPSPDIPALKAALDAALMAQLTARGLYRQALANLSDTMDRWGGHGGVPEVAAASYAVDTAREATMRAADIVERAEAALRRQAADVRDRAEAARAAEAAARFTAGVQAFKANVNVKALAGLHAAAAVADAAAAVADATEVDADATEPPPTLADLQEDFLETQEVLAAARRAHQRTARDLGDAETDADDAAALFAQALAA